MVEPEEVDFTIVELSDREQSGISEEDKEAIEAARYKTFALLRTWRYRFSLPDKAPLDKEYPALQAGGTGVHIVSESEEKVRVTTTLSNGHRTVYSLDGAIDQDPTKTVFDPSGQQINDLPTPVLAIHDELSRLLFDADITEVRGQDTEELS
jgi:hypothetical protein